MKPYIEENEQPWIGEVRRGGRIGKSNGHYYMWHACLACGKKRWVQYANKQAAYLHCAICSYKGRQGRGPNSASWKGGKIKSYWGYILIRLQPDDFFSPMADKSSYVLEHRLVVARRLGRNLQPWEIVHYKDHVRDHNEDSNLQLTSNDMHNGMTHYQNYIKRLKKENQELRDLVAELRGQGKTQQNLQSQGIADLCPDCSSKLQSQGGCLICPVCAWSKCE